MDGPADSSSEDSTDTTTFSVLKVRHYPFKGENTYVIWAQEVSDSRLKGVKAVKFTHQLHVTKNHIRQACRGTQNVTIRMPSGLKLYDPLGVVPESDCKNLQVVSDSCLTYGVWLEGLEDKSVMEARVRPVGSPHSEEDAEVGDGNGNRPSDVKAEESKR